MLTEALPTLREYAADIDRNSLHSSGRVRLWVRETLCALHGHELMPSFRPGPPRLSALRHMRPRNARLAHEMRRWIARCGR